MLKPLFEWEVESALGLPTDRLAYTAGPAAIERTWRFVADTAVPEGVLSGLHRAAAAAEEFMKKKAPWTDRSGKARAQVHTTAGRAGDIFFVVFGHGNDIYYGIYLETRFNGRFAIVIPTYLLFSALLPKFITKELDLAFAGRPSKYRHREAT